MSERVSIFSTDTNIPEIQELPAWAKKTQALQFYAVAKGWKRAMDAWVPSSKWDDFSRYCERFDIFAIPDVKFVRAEEYASYAKSIGANHLTTTKTLAEPIGSPSEGEIHTFLSRDPDAAAEAYRYWWYPVVMENRVVYKSYHDTIEFGSRLGYPHCCVEFFFEKNDWNSYNFPFEIFSRSDRYDYRCNPFWKDVGGSYVYHMPCRFDCPETVGWVEPIRESVFLQDSEFAREIERRLKLPVLSVREQKTYAFEGGTLDDGSVTYERFYRLGKEEEDDVSPVLERGNRVKILQDGTVVVFQDGTPVGQYLPKKESWAIESPFVISFE